MDKQWNYLIENMQEGFDFNHRNVYVGYQNPKGCLPMKNEYKPLSILQFVIGGKGTFAIDGFKSSKVGKGDVFYLPKGKSVSYWADADEPYEYYYLAIDPIDNDGFFEKLGFTLSNPVCRIENQKVFDLIGKLYEESKISSVTGVLKSFSVLYELLSLLAKSDKPTKDTALKNENIEKALIYINANYYKDINVNTIAKNVNLDRSYFTTLFTNTMGITPYKYLINLRISQACKLLASQYTVTEIAEKIGFLSTSIFEVHFKKIVKMTPREYRKSLENKD